jgi:pimeloyl-ACP methyl ester carboxylesterase
MPVLSTPDWMIDYLEAGEGPTVLLLHSSVSGNRQWRALMPELSNRYHVIALNLIGYGQTSPWSRGRPQTLADQSALIQPFLEQHPGPVALIGHSFGATVAMRVALDHPERVTRLMLLEPNLTQLLRHEGRDGAFAEAYQIRELVKEHGSRGDWEYVAAQFADYWNGEGTWATMPAERRATFAAALRPNYHEWDAVLGDRSLIDGISRLPAETTVVWARDSKRPMIEAVEVLRQHHPQWHYVELPEGGHMFPLTRPDLLSPIVRTFLDARGD